MRRVTFSRNFTLSLSRTCQCYCKYCAFATHRPHLHAPDEVERMLDDAARRGCKELLVLTGERPEVNDEVAAPPRDYGHEDFTSYVVWACERGLERGLLPHSNLGVLDRADLARLREVNASMGLMLESVSERLMDTVHAGSPTKHPAQRLATIEAAGELRIPFTSGILVGIGETEDERMASLEALAEVHGRHGHLQEVILQNFVPHPRYHGQEVADIADEAARRRWSDGDRVGDRRPAAARMGEPDHRRRHRAARAPLPRADAGRGGADPAQPLGLVAAARARGRDRPRRTVGKRRPHLARAPVPSPHQVRKQLAPEGFALTERLCVYPQYIDPEWIAQGVLDTIKLKYWSFIPRRGSGRRQDVPIRSDLAAGAIERARDGLALTRDELTALFAERRPEVIEDMRSAADELRARLAGDTATFVVNRNINFTNICQVGCAFCGFGQGKRSPDAYHVEEDDFVAKVREAVDYGVTEICMQGGIHPEYTLEDYGRWLKLVK